MSFSRKISAAFIIAVFVLPTSVTMTSFFSRQSASSLIYVSVTETGVLRIITSARAAADAKSPPASSIICSSKAVATVSALWLIPVSRISGNSCLIHLAREPPMSPKPTINTLFSLSIVLSSCVY